MITIQPKSPPKEYGAAWNPTDDRLHRRRAASKRTIISSSGFGGLSARSAPKRHGGKNAKSRSAAKKEGSKRKGAVVNPVLETAQFAYKATNLVQINDEGVKTAARYIKTRLSTDSYTPFTWRTHPLHICPDDDAPLDDPKNKRVLDWIFLISALNFSFWSDKEGKKDEVFGVEWREAWSGDYGRGESRAVIWTGYWSLVASLDRALADDHIPITDARFYACESLCPDSVIEHVFRPAHSPENNYPPRERLPLLKERIAVMRQVGKKLCDDFNGSFLYFVQAFHKRYNGKGTALDLAKMVAEAFPEFRDETVVEGQKVYLWKRAQILVAEVWAAFYPPSAPPALDTNSTPVTHATTTTTTTTADHHRSHPVFPHGSDIHLLTMFADYRVPQILHHLRILTYPPSLLDLLTRRELLPSGCREEVSLRAASIVAVEVVRKEIVRMARMEAEKDDGQGDEEVSSVLIDFYLWDLAKRIEDGEDKVQGIETSEMAPMHRTRSIWY